MGRFNYFEFRPRINFVPLRKQTLEIIGTLALSEEDFVGLKSLSNNYTKEYIKNKRLPIRRIYLRNERNRKINHELENLYGADRKLKDFRDDEVVDAFNKPEIIDIIIEEFSNYIHSINNPGKLKSKGKFNKKSKIKKIRKIRKIRKHTNKKFSKRYNKKLTGKNKKVAGKNKKLTRKK